MSQFIATMDCMDIATINLVRNGGSPLYLQLCEALERAIVSGELPQGERLPAERELAVMLGISRTTAVNAYRELEARGLVRGFVGRGTFVSGGPDRSGAPFSWRGKVARGALRTEDPMLRWMVKMAGNAEVISFAAATPAAECFPVDRFQEMLDLTLRRRGPAAVALSPTEGHQDLRRTIASWEGVRPEQVLIISGAQQGMDLVSRCLLDPGDTVIIDRPAYLGAIQVFRAAGAHLVSWDVDRADFDELEDLIVRYRPKLIYTNPTFQNPTGGLMSRPDRRELLELAARHRLPVIEDDPYSRLSFDGKRMPSLYELDEHQLVIHIGTFSKVLSGGLRLGWLIASDAIVDQLGLIKQRNDVSCPTLTQLAVSEFLNRGYLEQHLVELRAEHRRRYLAMCRAIERHVRPGELTFQPVEGGMYLWCRLTSGLDAATLLRAASSAGVIYAGGEAFYADGGGRDRLRLSFSCAPAPAIDTGIARLGALLHDLRATDSLAGTIPVAR